VKADDRAVSLVSGTGLGWATEHADTDGLTRLTLIVLIG
jgi:hypothetical protein